SPGQGARMNAVLAAGGARASLATSTGASRTTASLKSMSLYPNPASESLSLSLPAGADAAQYAVRVYDMSGHEMTGARYNGRGQLQVSALPRGLYYVTIGNGSETIRQRFEKE
ncbi:MAG TPA: T9SS type A sorting domain-containing protein, partial [Hymenobacter sp.]